MARVPVGYRRCWKAVVVALTGCVLVVGLPLWHSGTPMTAFLTVSIVTLALCCGLPTDPTERSAYFWGRAFRRSACAGAVGMAVVILGAVDERIAFGVLVLAAVTSPIAIDAALRVLGTRVGRQQPQRPAEPIVERVVAIEQVDPGDLDLLSDEALCHAWRRSFILLERTASVAGRSRVVAQRQRLLEELEHRHPAALQAWYDAGGRAASGPERFLRPQC
jgi:hypothetical protein